MYYGTIVPLVTPLDDAGAVCERSVATLIEHVRHDVNALMPTLSSGEGWKLDERQWTDMVRYTRKYAHGLPVLAGVQVPETADVIQRAKVAAELDVDAVVVTTPFRHDITQAEIEEHYRTVRAGVELPLFIYNEEALSGNRIELETLVRICQLPKVVGIKESSGSAEFTRKLLSAGLGVPVFEGWENLLLEVTGVQGFVGPLANLEPGLCGRMLVDPTPALQGEINQACERYGLFKPDWYRWAKRELHRRGVLSTDRIVDDGGEPR